MAKMSKLGYWVIRTYEAGMVGEKIKYWVPGARPTKSQRRLQADIKKQQQNESSAVKRAARLIHANFRNGQDVLLGLDYSEEGLAIVEKGLDAGAEDYMTQVYHAAHHKLRLWIRRTRRACKAAGVPFRCFAITSDMDGKTGETVRVHHHVVINKEALEIAMGKWTLGETHHGRLYDVVDQTALAEYLMNQVRRLPDEKKYIPSRNLISPPPKDRIAKSGAELAVPRGGQLLHRNEYKPGRPQYIRYIVPEVGKLRRREEKKVEDKRPDLCDMLNAEKGSGGGRRHGKAKKIHAKKTAGES